MKYLNKFKNLINNYELKKKAHIKEIKHLQDWVGNFASDHVWAFRGGTNKFVQEFSGNPKYLFIYINNYRPDIKAYFLCQDESSIDLIKSLGFMAAQLDSPEAAFLMERTGVYVDETVRVVNRVNPQAKFLNLWHGNGFKSVERFHLEDEDDLRFEIAEKYISNNNFLVNNHIVCAINPIQEEYFISQFGISKSHILRCGYARCTYQKKYKKVATYNHDLLKQKGLPQNTRLAVWAPTFRNTRGKTFIKAMKDLEELYKVCEKNNILLIFKVHPQMEQEAGFLQATELFQDRPYFLFWPSQNDIYEIMPQIDLLIYDYSSIFSDFVLAGCKHYIRYLFDDDISMNDWDEYFKNTRGHISYDWQDLLASLSHFEDLKDEEEPLETFLPRIWQYAGENDFEKTIRFVMNFKIGNTQLATLYSYDVFDTLISREALEPISIFYKIKDALIRDERFSISFIQRFPELRHDIEFGLRQGLNRTMEQRNSLKREITLEMIYEKMQEVENLSDAQKKYLYELECNAELDAVVPIKEQIEEVKKLLRQKEKVVLISDMYLPKELITKMLNQADPMLGTLPLFLSNEYGVLKSDRLLFFEVYRSFGAKYFFGKWIHTGDNANADQKQPRRLGIWTRLIEKPIMNELEKEMLERLDSYDGCKVAAMAAKLRFKNRIPKCDFVIDFVAPLLVSYVDWVIRDAEHRGFKTLYFVSRDGYNLKLVADSLIKELGLQIKTKYIYASRRLWRLPSYIDKVDDEFFQDYGGNFNDIFSKEQFLRAAYIKDENDFKKMFSYIDLDAIDFTDWTNGQPARKLAKMMKENKVYHEYLLKEARQKRGIVCDYLRQEIDPQEPHAFVEFYGRGYNQLCHSRLWKNTIGKAQTVNYYYANTVFPYEENCASYCMTKTDFPLYHIESIFANMPYKTIEEYKYRKGKVEPVIRKIDYDKDLFNAMETLLPIYASHFAHLNFSDPIGMDKNIFSYILRFFKKNEEKPFLYENFGPLYDAIAMHAHHNEFARKYTLADIEKFKNGIPRGRGTQSITMSYMRSDEEVKEAYRELYQIEPGDNPAEGSRLSAKQIIENRKYKEMTLNNQKDATYFESLYHNACRLNNVKNQVLLITGEKVFGDMFYAIKTSLKKQKQMKVETICCGEEIDMPSIAGTMASSLFVIAFPPLPFLSGLNLRCESKLILLSPSAFEIAAHGYAAKYKLKWQQRYEETLYNIRANAVDIPSKEEKLITLKRHNLDLNNVDVIKGCAITDVYFDPTYHKKAFQKFSKLFPNMQGKKIILYMLNLRKKRHQSEYPEIIDLHILQKLLPKDYVVIVDVRRSNKDFVKECRYFLEVPGFSILSSSEISLRKLVVVADIIMGDYRDTLFEATLLKKPVFFTGYDYEWYQRSHSNIERDFAKIVPFPIVKNAKEAAKEILHVKSYDYETQRTFLKKYLEYCDGHTAERLLKYMKIKKEERKK